MKPKDETPREMFQRLLKEETEKYRRTLLASGLTESEAEAKIDSALEVVRRRWSAKA